MNTGKSYDAIILGAGFSGLLVGALLSKRGRQVLVLEEELVPGGLYSQEVREGFLNVREPVLFLGFEQDGLYDRLFMELGVSLSLLKNEGELFQRPNPSFQLVLPEQRINFYKEPQELFDELFREFPGDIRKIRLLWEEMERWEGILHPAFHLPPKRRPRDWGGRVQFLLEDIKLWTTIHKLKRQKAGPFLDTFGLSPAFCRGLELLLVLCSGRTLSEATGLDFLLMLSLFCREIVTLRGGVSRLSELLIKIIQEYKGDVILGSSLVDIVVHQRKIRAIRTREGVIPVTGNVIINIPSVRLSRPRKERRFMTAYFSVETRTIPPAMSPYLIMTRDIGRQPLGDNLLFLVLGEKREGRNPSGSISKDLCQLRILIGLGESESPTENDLEKWKHSISVQLTDLMPFSKSSLEFLGYEIDSTREKTRLSSVKPFLLSSTRARGPRNSIYYSSPIRNLFLLPDEGQLPIADIRSGRSALALVNQITFN